ncbi:MAG: nickel pincer cofactor biosynthesis protein LarB [Bacteroidota bacterium]|nr:nickel pincer cofactor biosynthesis protein LarB [Bacteroidota bacterium]MDP4241285.1 nickel pincer cofactor biosynthesis protein LarB [Bacteroidota bacterium]MDP4286677.1 nickel pincer cofactor biosynthesis protein LarB [Bacteroidota bacterium]
MADARKLHRFATLDHDRERRQGFPEVIYSEGKTAYEVAAIAESIYERSGRMLATRATLEQFNAVKEKVPASAYNERARAVYALPDPATVSPSLQAATIAVIAAGTSDQPVSEEAAITLEVAGIGHVERIYDVGVAGIHRLLERTNDFGRAQTIIVCAGMEGALPSVVGGLVRVPVIAVPTSVGYGASFGGVAALLGMLNSCASGITVVNIDNGFGAAMAAIRILGAITNGE